MKHGDKSGMPSGHMATTTGGTDAPAGEMMAMLQAMPPGITSPSGRYWCAMCKKMFETEDATCPYMPTMCVNTPIAIETLPPGSAAFYERVGLFYPKIVQRLLATSVARAADPEALGVAYAENYLADLAEWNVQYRASPLETIKSFLIYTSGFDVATRSTVSGMTFLLLDAQSLWGEDISAKKRSKRALLAGTSRVARAVGLEASLDLHFMGVTSGAMGRYFCAQCNMFFEYGQQQPQVTCPFMSQKCKFRPKPLPEALASSRDERDTFSLDVLTQIYKVSPKLYRRNLESAIGSAPDTARGQAPFTAAAAAELLREELRTWRFDLTAADELASLLEQLGL
jgi:DNA-directed RNA polymerase subunit RPC12/RpoP